MTIVHDNGTHEVLEVHLKDGLVVYGIRPKHYGSGDIVWMERTLEEAVRTAELKKGRSSGVTHEEITEEVRLAYGSEFND